MPYTLLPPCSVPALCHVRSHRLDPPFSGCHGLQNWGTQQGKLRHRALISTHQIYTHDISKQQNEVTAAKLAQASCTTSLKERGEPHSDCPYDSVLHLWYQVLGCLSWAIDEDKDPWKELSCEWENCSFHLAQSFQFYQLSWCGCQTFKSVVFQIIPRTLFWRPVSYLQPFIILSLSALNCISNRTIAATCINLFWPWEEVRFSLHVYANHFLTLISCKDYSNGSITDLSCNQH